MTHGSEWDMEIWRSRLKMSHDGADRVWHFQPRVVIFPCHTNDGVSYVLLYGQLQEFWIMSGLQWRNVNEYHLPSKNAHSPNYCSWLAVCVNYSAKFYCKIALINRFELYLTKTYNKTPKKNKKKLNVNKNNVAYILRVNLVNITWRHTVWHYNVTPGDREAVNIMLNVTWRRFDQSAKQLIVGHSYDNIFCLDILSFVEWLGSRVVSVLGLRRRSAWVQIAAATLSGNSQARSQKLNKEQTTPPLPCAPCLFSPSPSLPFPSSFLSASLPFPLEVGPLPGPDCG